ncbi:MAG: molecular chaperone DnaJ [Candidatus Eremiobacteraeota bacterium]|nr:molecular chaperone DnaJ [Candidatus Eremiobacteraeota bacterium]
MTKDFYDVLGITRSATADEIKRAYRALARTHHPDVSDDKAGAEHRFKAINEAYEVLSDPQKRAQYDRFGSVGGNGGPSAGFGDFGFAGQSGFGDIFDMFFGEARAGAAQGARQAGGAQRGSDLRYDLEVTLEQAFSGTTQEIQFNHLAQCETCKGSGAAPNTLVIPCDRCSGTGVMRMARQTPLGQFVTQTTCNKCGGDGQVIQQPCPACAGRGRREMERKLTVKVPAGIDDGSRIRINGSGEAGIRGGPAGDLYVYLTVRPHPMYRRDGMDTYIDVPMSFSQAALGGSITVPSLEGDLPLTIGPGTQTGTVFRMRGHGMPGIRGSHRGDHVVTAHVAVPSKVTRRQRELLEEYARIGGDTIEEKSFLDRFKDAFKPD